MRVVRSLFVLVVSRPPYRYDWPCLRLFCDADPPGCRYPRNFVAVEKFRERLLVGRRLESSGFSVFVGGG